MNGHARVTNPRQMACVERMTSILTLPARSVAWLDTALQACLEFPAAVRSRVGCELITLHRAGLSPSWERVRGMSGAVSLGIRSVTPRSSRTLHRLICVTSIPQAFVIVHAFTHDTTRPEARVPQRELGFARARTLDVTFDIQERRSTDTARVQRVPISSNVFLQLGFPDEEGAELLQKAELIAQLRQTLRRYGVDLIGSRADATTRAVISGEIESISVAELRALALSVSNSEDQ